MCLCWMVCLPSRGLVSACLRLSPHNMRLCWMVCPPSQGLVSPCRLPSFPCFNGVPAFSRSCLPWSPIAPHSLPLSPSMCTCVGWCVCLPDVLFPNCLPLSPHVCLCWMVCPPSRSLVSPCLPSCLSLSPVVSTCFPLSPIVSRCLQLFPIVSPHVPVLDGPPSRSVGFDCLPLSP